MHWTHPIFRHYFILIWNDFADTFSSRNHKRCMFNRCKYTYYSRNSKDFYRKLSFKRTTVVTIKGKLPWQWKNSCRDNVRIAVVIIKEQLLRYYLNRLLRYYLNLTCQMFSTGYRCILKRLWMSIRKLRTEIQSFRISVRSFRTKRNKSSALCYYIDQYNTLYSDKVQ